MSLKIIRFFIGAVLFIQSFLPLSVYAGPIESSMVQLFGNRVDIRKQDTCGIYLAPANYVIIDHDTQTSIEGGQFDAGDPFIPEQAIRWPQNASGFQLTSSHELKDLRTAFYELIQQVGKGTLDGEIIIKNVPHPLFNSFASDFMLEVDKLFTELDLDPNKLKVSFSYQLNSQGIKGLTEKFLHWWPQILPSLKVPFVNKKTPPFTEDFDPPIGVETKKAVPIVLASEIPTAIVAVASFWGQPEVFIPIITGYFILLSAIVAYSRTIANWMGREGTVYSQSNTINGIQKQMNLFLKQVLLSALIIGNYKLWGHSAEIAQIWADSSALDFTKSSLDGVWGFVFGKEGVTTLIQSFYYHTTFSNGIFKWESDRVKDPLKQEMARNTKAGLTGLLYMIGGPILLWATMSGPQVGELNWGQILLLVMTATIGGFFSYAANKKPELIDNYVAPFVINKLNPPLDFVAKNMRKVVEPPLKLSFNLLDKMSRGLGLKKKP